MLLDPVMQRIGDFGPLSVFLKEIRTNCGRFFLGTPLALFSILVMPLAIALGFRLLSHPSSSSGVLVYA